MPLAAAGAVFFALSLHTDLTASTLRIGFATTLTIGLTATVDTGASKFAVLVNLTISTRIVATLAA